MKPQNINLLVNVWKNFESKITFTIKDMKRLREKFEHAVESIKQLEESRDRWNVHLNNVTMNGTQGWSGNCVNSSILNGIIVGCND